MPERECRRLIVNADDFGRSSEINEAIAWAHRNGILTTASLMVNETACSEAIRLARDNPALGVGLHLTLLCGRSALPHSHIPDLVDESGQFTRSPVGAGWKYFFHPALRQQIRAEIHAQFERFRNTGLMLDHVNAHLHLHLHPMVFSILMEDARRLRIERMRLTQDPFLLDLRLSSGSWPYRLSHALIFSVLSRRARTPLADRGIVHTRSVFGLLRNARVDEEYVLRLLVRLPNGDSELYSHPVVGEFGHELDALVSPRVRYLVSELGIQLVRYQDL